MRDTIEGLDWMSAETKKRALEKLATFNPKIGYPDKWKDYSQRRRSRATSYWDDVVARRASSASRTTSRRSASPSIAAAGA